MKAIEIDEREVWFPVEERTGQEQIPEDLWLRLKAAHESLEAAENAVDAWLRIQRAHKATYDVTKDPEYAPLFKGVSE